MREVLPRVFHWTAVHPRIQIEVSSFWLDEGGVLIDPLVPAEAGLEWFARRATPRDAGRTPRPRATLHYASRPPAPSATPASLTPAARSPDR